MPVLTQLVGLAMFTAIVILSATGGVAIFSLLTGELVFERSGKFIQASETIAIETTPGRSSIRVIPIEVEYQGKRVSCNAIVDTGAEVIALTKPVLESLGIPVDGERRVSRTINGEKMLVTLKNVSIHVGQASLKEVDVYALEEGKVPTKDDLGRDQCVLGQPFISNFKFTQTPDRVEFAPLDSD